MMNKYVLPEDSLSKLICFVCEKPLSYFPIYFAEAGPSCGRCEPAQNGGFRCQIFEEIAKNVEFPCGYKQNGCLEILLSKDVENHELHCKFQTFACPFACLCNWKGIFARMQEFLKHTEDVHPTSLLADCCFEVDFINTHNELKLMHYLDGLYLINYQCSENQMISCTVTQFGYEPVDDNLNYKIIFEEWGIQFGQLSRYNSFWAYSELNDTVHIDKSALNVLLKNPAAVLARIEILQNKQPVSKNANADELLKHFECNICMDYMIGSIYQCARGHSMCEPCKERVEECPTCKSLIQTTRNFTLEGLVSDFEFPCKYEKCPFVGKGSVIKEHQNACKFIENDCPLKELYACEKKFVYTELSNHIYEEHNENWYECDVISIPFALLYEGVEYKRVFFLKYRSKLFRLNFSYRNALFIFIVKLMDSTEESSKYRFVLDILDTTNRENRLCCSKNLNANGQNIEIDFALIDYLIGEEFKFRLFVLEN